ncbi:MAG: hypothetical protein ABFE07_28120 [Armatimonadia bacterium]
MTISVRLALLPVYPEGCTYVPLHSLTDTNAPQKPRKTRLYPIDREVLRFIKKQRKASGGDIARHFGRRGWLPIIRACVRLEKAGKIRAV